MMASKFPSSDRDYLARLDTRPLPGPEQWELIALAQRENTARAYLRHADEDTSFPITEADRRRLREIVRVGAAARSKLIQHSMRFVWGWAKKYVHRARMASEGDLIAEGVLGLMKAIDMFEVERGWQFTTYAGNWVRAHMGRYTNYNNAAVYIPNHRTEDVARVRRRRWALEKLGMTRVEIDDALVREFGDEPLMAERTIVGGVRDMDETFESEQGERSLHDIMASEDPSPEALVIDKDFREKMLSAAGMVSVERREFAIIHDRLLGSANLRDIGDRYGVTRERVRQLEAGVLPRLRRAVSRLLPDEASDCSRPAPERAPRRNLKFGSMHHGRWKDASPPPMPAPPPVRHVTVSATGVQVGQVVPPAAKSSRRFVPDAEPPPFNVEEERRPMTEPRRADAPLTDSQQRILALTNEGKSPKDIACAVGTTREYVYALQAQMRKRGLLTKPPRRGPKRPDDDVGLTEHQRAVKVRWDAGLEAVAIASETGRKVNNVRSDLRVLHLRGQLTRAYGLDANRARGVRKAPRPGLVFLPTAAPVADHHVDDVTTTTEGETPMPKDDEKLLTENQRQILAAYERGGTIAEVASECGTTSSSVNSCIFELRKRGLVKRAKFAGSGFHGSHSSPKKKGAKAAPVKAKSRAVVHDEDPVVAGLQAKLDELDEKRATIEALLTAARAAFDD